jgi:YVTN family beta-propeller protein
MGHPRFGADFDRLIGKLESVDSSLRPSSDPLVITDTRTPPANRLKSIGVPIVATTAVVISIVSLLLYIGVIPLQQSPPAAGSPETSARSDPIPVGGGPASIAISPDGEELYVSNSGNSTISVIDIRARAVISTVPVGASPRGVAVSPDGKQIVVANSGDNSVSIIDRSDRTQTRPAVRRVSVGYEPVDVEIPQHSDVAYVAEANSQDGAGTISVVNLHDFTSSRTDIRTDSPSAIAISPDGRTGYLANPNAIALVAFDTQTLVEKSSFPLAGNDVEITPDGRKVYLIEENADTVSVIDAATGQLTATIPVGLQPTSVVFTPARAIVANSGANTLSIIDVATNAIVDTVSITGITPIALAVSHDYTTVYTADFYSNTVSTVRLQ